MSLLSKTYWATLLNPMPQRALGAPPKRARFFTKTSALNYPYIRLENEQ